MSKIIENMSAEDYHAHPAISKSKLDLINKSPAHYWAELSGLAKREPSKAMIRGSVFHVLALEPQNASKLIAVEPEVNGRTNAGKAELAAFEANNTGKIIISASDYRDVERMALSFRESIFHVAVTNGKAEVSLFAEIDGVAVKARPDFITDSGWLIDLKTTSDASNEGFDKSIFNFRYYVQAAFYMDVYEMVYGAPARGFIFFPVENTAPFQCGAMVIMKADSPYLEYGRQEYKRNLATYKECQETGNWYGYFKDAAQSEREAEMPYWLEKRLINQGVI